MMNKTEQEKLKERIINEYDITEHEIELIFGLNKKPFTEDKSELQLLKTLFYEYNENNFNHYIFIYDAIEKIINNKLHPSNRKVKFIKDNNRFYDGLDGGYIEEIETWEELNLLTIKRNCKKNYIKMVYYGKSVKDYNALFEHETKLINKFGYGYSKETKTIYVYKFEWGE